MLPWASPPMLWRSSAAFCGVIVATCPESSHTTRCVAEASMQAMPPGLGSEVAAAACERMKTVSREMAITSTPS
jgi:hypothetical protein